MENDFFMWICICLIANVVPYWNLLICIWCYFIIQWNNKWNIIVFVFIRYHWILIRAPELKAQALLWLCVVCRPSVITLNIIDFSETVERNSMKFYRNLSNPLPNLCFWVDWKTKNAAMASDWPRHFWLLWNCWTEFNETWQEASSQHPLPSLCFGAIGNQDGHPGLWLAETFFTSSLQRLNRIQRNLTGTRSQCFLPISCIWGRWENNDGCIGLWFFETS